MSNRTVPRSDVELPQPPEHLSLSSKTLWGSIVSNFVLEPHHLRLLQAACESLDRAEEARQAVEREGAFSRDVRGVWKAHPGIRTERESRAMYSRLLRELGLDHAVGTEESRPNAITGRASR